ncbi:hypothetical protein KJ951_02210 [Patescibacteria group bacterium]|nr:hypothetical protein [Patescibacteria group bacterium]MBU1703194.1 hypothetical protein [Patescibacteria group bacterium]MBU1953522.1 hypothetical protein [Patescibacteria group bacterium]
MKKTLIIPFTLLSILIIGGCQQVQKLQDDATNTIDSTVKKVEDIKSQAMETKAAVEEKINQAQDAADAIKKLTE